MSPSRNQELPPALLSEAQQAWRRALECAEEPVAEKLTRAFAANPAAGQLYRVLACSPFAAALVQRRPELLLTLVESGDLFQSLQEHQFCAALQQRLSLPDAELSVVLRRYRQQHMLRIVWRDFCRLSDTRETVRDTSLLAEAVIGVALDSVQADMELRFGVPLGRDSGERQQMIVLAMGKLGAGELNISSDIDLIFAYPEAGRTDGTSSTLSNEQFFTRVGQGLITALDQTTAEGFVFRVDMRLRPYGESGALVHNFQALESYYQAQGRDWERYALIKARPVTGDQARAAELMKSLQPFVYRRYVDFGVIESLRSMKRMITAEVRRRGLQDNVKLGPGGIREVEFIAQCFQLIRGGRDLALQRRELLPVLRECAALGCLPVAAAQELEEAYLFLRDTEHALQGYEDKQTQELPVAELPRLAVAAVMGSDSWEEFFQRLQSHRAQVALHFSELIASEEDGDQHAGDDLGLWGQTAEGGALAALGYQRPDETLDAILSLQQHVRVASLQAEGRQRLDQFMPHLLRACAEVESPDAALQRILPLVLAVVRRSVYLAMLLENRPALAELVALCAASPWISEQLTRNPVLLDELLDRASLYAPPDEARLADELRQQAARLAPEDLEAQMDMLRYFKASQVLRVAASEVSGRLPVMQVSDNLTWIAQVILQHVLRAAWADLVQKYGEPARDSSDCGFAVFGYGKLGGIELGYGSDLDLVLVFDAHSGGITDGQRSIDNTVFYTRLGQRMIHILEARMAMGQLYEVDMRLRPSGESGMLVTTVKGFHHYQQESAWTWEHQALVRSRFVAGDTTLASQVDAVRAEILAQPRDEASLAGDVIAMRDKMRKHLLPKGQSKEGEFHLKQGHGGIVDIEFMVQYAVLAWSNRAPGLVRWSDNVRILETLGREGLFEQHECDALTGAYLAFRSAAHQLSLQRQSDIVPAVRFVDARSAVDAKWRQLFAPYMNAIIDE